MGIPTRRIPSNSPPPFPLIPGVRFGSKPELLGYAVSDDGNVWTCKKKFGSSYERGWRKLRPSLSKTGGYPFVALWMNGKQKSIKVHTLVLEVFVGPKPLGMESLHGNADRTDNRVGNLRWGTRLENMQDRDRHGNGCQGSKHPQAKLDEEKVREIIRLYESGLYRQKEIGARFGIGSSLVSNIVTRRRWKHVG